MRQHSTIIVCDSCGKKTTCPRHLRDVETPVAFNIRSYCIGVNQGPDGADKEFADLDICETCDSRVPYTGCRTLAQTKEIVEKIKAGEFARKKTGQKA